MKEEIEEPSSLVTLTNSQFQDLKKFLQSYLKVTALGAIREVSDKEIEKNVWILNVADFKQEEIAKILKTSQGTVSKILAGKPVKLTIGEEEDK